MPTDSEWRQREAAWQNRERALLQEIAKLRAEIERLQRPGTIARLMAERSKQPHQELCVVCGTTFLATRPADTCSAKCRQAKRRRTASGRV
jgi:hypothetical protein